MRNKEEIISHELQRKLNDLDSRLLNVEREASQLKTDIQLLKDDFLGSKKKSRANNLARYWKKYKIASTGTIFYVTAVVVSVTLTFLFNVSPLVRGTISWFGLFVFVLSLAVQYVRYRTIFGFISLAIIPIYLSVFVPNAGRSDLLSLVLNCNEGRHGF